MGDRLLLWLHRKPESLVEVIGFGLALALLGVLFLIFAPTRIYGVYVLAGTVVGVGIRTYQLRRNRA